MTFHISREDWSFINSFAEWISAFGSILASIVALYLSRTNHVKVRVNASLGALITQNGSLDNLLIITVVNCGARQATITGIEFRFGIFRKRRFFMIVGGLHQEIPFPQQSLPVVLEDGKKVDWVFRAGTGNSSDQFKILAKSILDSGVSSKNKLWNLNIIVHTSIGKLFKSRADNSIRNNIIKCIKIVNK